MTRPGREGGKRDPPTEKRGRGGEEDSRSRLGKGKTEPDRAAQLVVKKAVGRSVPIKERGNKIEESTPIHPLFNVDSISLYPSIVG